MNVEESDNVTTASVVVNTTIAHDNSSEVSSSVPCPLMLFMSFGGTCAPLIETLPLSSDLQVLDHLAAALMAMQHFNDRNDVIVPELSTSPVIQNCSVQFPPPLRVVDTAGYVQVGGSAVIQQLKIQERNNGDDICGLIGGDCDSIAIELSALAASIDIPFITYAAFDDRLTDTSQYPLTTIASMNRRYQSEAILDSIIAIAKRENYITAIYPTRESGRQVSETLEQEAADAGVTHFRQIQYSPSPDYDDVMKEAKEVGFRTIVLVAPVDIELRRLAVSAEKNGLLNGEYFFTVEGMPIPDILSVASQHEPTSKLINGSSLVIAIDGYAYKTQQEKEDDFLREFHNWTAQNSTTALLREFNPLSPGNFFYRDPVPSYFQDRLPSAQSAYMYDAIMMMGIGKCQALADEAALAANGNGGPRSPANGPGGPPPSQNGGPPPRPPPNESGGPLPPSPPNEPTPAPAGSDVAAPSNGARSLVGRRSTVKGERRRQQEQPGGPPPGEGGLPSSEGPPPPPPSGTKKKKKSSKNANDPFSEIQNPVMKGIIFSNFTGATGRVEHQLSGTVRTFRPTNRDRDNIPFGRYNFLQRKDENFVAVLTDYQIGAKSQNWTSLRSFQYADGTNSPPLLLRDVPYQHYLSNGVQIVGITLMALGILFTIVSALFVTLNRTHSVIKGAQPEFLLVMLFGAAMLVASIFPMSFDEEDGWSAANLSGACQTTPWLLVLGYMTIHCALFSKLWRIHRVLQFRARTKVTIKAVMGPFLCMMLAAICALTVWTAADPLKWIRSEIVWETGESLGKCEGVNPTIFVSLLGVMMGSATLMTCVMAWITKDVDTKYSESSWIFYTVFVQIQILIVGFPVLFLLDEENVDVIYLARFLLIWLVTMTTMGLMIIPKLFWIFHPPAPSRGSSAGARGSTMGVRIYGGSAFVNSSGMGVRKAGDGSYPIDSASTPPTSDGTAVRRRPKSSLRMSIDESNENTRFAYDDSVPDEQPSYSVSEHGGTGARSKFDQVSVDEGDDDGMAA